MPSHTLKTFVDNRVAEVQEATSSHDWRHLPTLDNLADMISRGLSPRDILDNDLWTQGPQWLIEDSDSWPKLSFQKKRGARSQGSVHYFIFRNICLLLRIWQRCISCVDNSFLPFRTLGELLLVALH